MVHYSRPGSESPHPLLQRLNIRALEMDFFMLFLQEHPTVLLGKQTVKSNGTVAALKTRIRDLDKAIDDATALVGKLPISQLEARLTGLVKEREIAGRELETANLKLMSSAAAPTAFESIRGVLSGFSKLGWPVVRFRLIQHRDFVRLTAWPR